MAPSHYLNVCKLIIHCGLSYLLSRPLYSSPPSASFMHQWIGSALVPLSEPMLYHCQLRLQWNYNEIGKLSFRKMHLKILSAKLQPFYTGGDGLMMVLIMMSHVNGCSQQIKQHNSIGILSNIESLLHFKVSSDCCNVEPFIVSAMDYTEMLPVTFHSSTGLDQHKLLALIKSTSRI